MRGHHFHLLGYRRETEGVTPTGPLGELLAQDSHGDVARRLRCLGGPLTAVRSEVELLGLRLGLDGCGHLVGKPTGLAAPFLKTRLDELLRDLDSRKTVAWRDDAKVCYLRQPVVPSPAFARGVATRLFTRVTGIARPTFCTLQVTARCQCRGAHCSAALIASHGRPELGLTELRDVIDQALALGVVTVVLTGGEPLTRPDLPQIVAHVPRDRANVMLFTNGWLLTDSMVRRLREAGLFSLQVSLDDHRAERHDALRSLAGCYERAVAGIRRALDAGLLVGISTYATHQRVADGGLSRMVDLARGLGVHELTIFDAVPTGRLRDPRWLLDDADRRQIGALVAEADEKSGTPLVLAQCVINGPEGYGCFAGFHQFYVTAHGDVTPCDVTPLGFGNVRQTPLFEIWNRLVAHPAYATRSPRCRMQDVCFRRTWIDPSPSGASMPFDTCARPVA